MTAIIAPPHVTPELILIGFVATFLTVATAWIIWYAAEKVFPNEVGQLQFFLTFIVVIIPFVMLIYFGLDAIVDDAVTTQAGWPPELPFELLPETPVLVVVYIGLTVAGAALAQTIIRQRAIPR
jgi:hypothetical protein